VCCVVCCVVRDEIFFVCGVCSVCVVLCAVRGGVYLFLRAGNARPEFWGCAISGVHNLGGANLCIYTGGAHFGGI
jgi:hypothetical protein